MKTIIIDENYKGIEKYNDFWFVYKGNMKILGNLKININLIVEGNQIVKGYQIVNGNQKIKGNQRIGDYQRVEGIQRIGGYQRINGNQIVKGYQIVEDHQLVKGNQIVEDKQRVEGYQIVEGEMKILGLKTKFSLSILQEEYRLYFMSNIIKIGCEQHSPEEWKNFSDEEISDMDEGALEWWNRWKKFVLNTHANLVEVYNNDAL